MLDNDSLEMALCLETHAIKVLRSCQHARPTRIPRLLARALAANGGCLIASDCHSERIQELEEAIYIQVRVAKSVQEDDIDPLFRFVVECLAYQLPGKRWEDAVGTFKWAVEIAEPDS